MGSSIRQLRVIAQVKPSPHIVVQARPAGPKGDDGKDAETLVSSVAGKQGAVVLSKADVGLNMVDNTSDLGKPISNLMAIALARKGSRQAITVAPFTYAGEADLKCDGIDDHIEINAAIEEAISSGIRTVQLLAGVFYTTSSIILKSELTMRGAGMKLTVIAGSVMTNGILRPVGSGASTPTTNLTLSDFMIDGSGLPNIAVTPNKGLSGQFYINLQASNLYCYNTPATGFGPDYLQGSSFTNCIADSCGRLAGDPGFNGFGIGTGGWDQESCQWVNCHAYNCGNNGFLLEDQAINAFATRDYNLKLTNCTALNCRKGFRISGTPGTSLVNCTGNNNREQGVYVARYGNRDCADTQVIGGHFAYNTTAGVLIAYDNAEGGNNSMNALLDGLHSHHNGQYGVFVGGNNRARITNIHSYENAWEGIKYHIFDSYGPRYATEISSVTVYNNGKNVTGAGSHHGIYIHAQNAPLYGLTLRDIFTYDDQKDSGGALAPTQWFGVYVNGAVHDLTIDNVNARDLYKDGIYVSTSIPNGTTDTINIRGLKLLNSTIVNCGKGAVSLQNEGIRIVATSTAPIVGALIQGNHAYDTQAVKTQTYGLVLKDYVLSSTISNNDFRDNSSGALNDSSVSGAENVFFNNFGIDPQGQYLLGDQASTFNVDASKGRVQGVRLTGNASANFFTAKDGDRLTLVVSQDAVGGRKLTLPSWAQPLSLSTNAGAVDTISFIRSSGAWSVSSFVTQQANPGPFATRVTQRAAATTIDATYCSVELNTTATQTLPALSTCQGRMYEFVNINASAASIKGSGSEVIGNVTTANTYSLPSGAAVTLKAFPSAWRVI